MVDKEQFGKEQRAEGEDERQRKLVRTFINKNINKGKTEEKAIELAIEYLDITREEVLKALE